MTTAIPNRATPESTVLDGVLRGFAERAITGKNAGNQGSSEIRWLASATVAIACLPWFEDNLPDGRTAPQPGAAAELLWLLVRALDDTTIPPTGIVPTWRGGVTAEWHVRGFDLEITCDPDGTIEYNFAGPGIEEYEGPVDETLTQLKRHVRMLPEGRD